jgi:hypothetical protein
MAKHNDAIFVARRAWDQRAEAGYMKRIEDMRAGGRWPARQLNGIRIQTMINRIRRSESLSTAQWGIIRAHEGEFLVPDISYHPIVPLTPTLCLVPPAPNGTSLKQNVALINRSIKAASDAYFFARDLSKCSL